MADLNVLAVVDVLPKCDFCKLMGIDRPARYDFKSLAGMWAYGCRRHWEVQRQYNELGLGMGQTLMTRDEMEIQLG